MENGKKATAMKKELFFSVVIHAAFITAIIAFGSYVKKEVEPVVVFLIPDSGGGGGGGGGGQTVEAPRKMKPAPQERRPVAAKAQTTHVYSAVARKDVQPLIQERRIEPEAAVATAVTPRNETVSVPSSSEIAHSGTGEGSGGGHGTGIGTGVGTGAGSGSGTGTGSGSGAGSGRSEGSGSGPGESTTSLKDRYLREHFDYIKELINKNLTYPPMARKQGWQGLVTVSFIILESGNTKDIKIIKSSGYDVLDRDVVATIKRIQPFPRPPVEAQLSIPVRYRLE